MISFNLRTASQTYKILVGKYERKKPFGISRWEDNIKMYTNEKAMNMRTELIRFRTETRGG
jgi:hypothetical protein